MRRLLPALAAFTLLLLTPAFADEAKPYIDNTVIDLTMILPPPPADDSAKTKEELGQVLTIQVTRTPEMVERAKADDEESVWRFADVVGPKLSKDSLPLTAAFFDRVAATEGAVVDPAKKIFKRPRPYQMIDIVQPVLEKSKSGAWPSGHATVGTMMGILLSDMIPEKRHEIMDRAWEFGWNRVIAGMHCPGDIEVGRISGAVITSELFKHDDFKADYEAARKELRAALGMSS
jgi:acid phosphatase (class A)